MTEIYNKKYRPIGEGTFGHVVLREHFVPTAALVLNTPYTDAMMEADFYGFSRQSFKVVPRHGGGGVPTLDVEIQEFISDPADPTQGVWATKGDLGVGSAAVNVLFEHNGEDTMRRARIRITPKTAVVDSGVLIEIGGRRDT